MHNRRFSRRLFVGGGLVLMGCGGIPAPADEPELPPAPWPEDDMAQQPSNDLTQPLMLWGSVDAEPNVDSPVPNEQLANPFGLPMELLGIRFLISPLVSDASGFIETSTGGAVKVRLDLGPAAIASDIPVAIFGDKRDTYENLGPDEDGVYPTLYDWRLKYPLFIPAGKVVTAVFTPIGLNPVPVRVDVLYMCRTWDPARPEPKRVKVPWAASFETKTFKYETDALADQSVSSNLDVVNPFSVPLELSRIGGRCTVFNPVQRFIAEDVVEFRAVLSTMRMRSSRGFDIIRTPVPFEGVFPLNWRSWEILDGWAMAPQEYYRIQIDTAELPYATVGSLNTATAQFSVGVVGYRDVDVASIRGAP